MPHFLSQSLVILSPSVYSKEEIKEELDVFPDDLRDGEPTEEQEAEIRH